jgi:hypothetical protein
MHGGAISPRTRSGKTRPNRPASSQRLPEGGTITTPPYNAPMVGGVFPVAANLAPVREVPLLGDQPSVPTQQSIGRNSDRESAAQRSAARQAYPVHLRRASTAREESQGSRPARIGHEARAVGVDDDDPWCLMAQPLIPPIGSSPPSPRRSLASARGSRGRRALLAAASRARDSIWHRVSRPACRLARSSSAAEVQIDCANTSVTSIRLDMRRVVDDSVRQLCFGNGYRRVRGDRRTSARERV